MRSIRGTCNGVNGMATSAVFAGNFACSRAVARDRETFMNATLIACAIVAATSLAASDVLAARGGNGGGNGGGGSWSGSRGNGGGGQASWKPRTTTWIAWLNLNARA